MKWANFLHIYQPAEQRRSRSLHATSLKPIGFNISATGKLPFSRPLSHSGFQMKINEDVISSEQAYNLLLIAGFASGIGEWRPERNGDFGTFEVVSTK